MHAVVCDFILDCLQNSVEAESAYIFLRVMENADILSVEIRDDGIGMTEKELQKAVDPFYTNGLKHEKRRVGLGLPFMIQAVQLADGEWSLDSVRGKGTELFFSFSRQHVDTPPLGDISGMLLQALMFDGDFELEFERKIEKKGKIDSYRIKRREMLEILGDINDSDSLIMARQFLKSQEDCLLEGEI